MIGAATIRKSNTKSLTYNRQKSSHLPSKYNQSEEALETGCPLELTKYICFSHVTNPNESRHCNYPRIIMAGMRHIMIWKIIDYQLENND